ncbi:hypothetical protein [Macrococcus epidermidis]|nr:hypothetical protein [Macrococcus epidermidis]
MKKTITIGSTLLAGTLSMTFVAPNYADAAGYYYWHKGDMMIVQF